MTLARNKLGVITSGSLLEGLQARLEGGESVEDLRVGKFVVVEPERVDCLNEGYGLDP